MRVCEKKKLYKRFCRDQVKAGKINNAEGHWIPFRDSGTYGRMHADQRNGYKLG